MIVYKITFNSIQFNSMILFAFLVALVVLPLSIATPRDVSAISCTFPSLSIRIRLHLHQQAPTLATHSQETANRSVFSSLPLEAIYSHSPSTRFSLQFQYLPTPEVRTLALSLPSL